MPAPEPEDRVRRAVHALRHGALDLVKYALVVPYVAVDRVGAVVRAVRRRFR